MRLQMSAQMGLPIAGASVLIIHPDDDFDFTPAIAPHIVTPFKPSFDQWAARGVQVFDAIPTANYDIAIVCAGKSKPQTKDAIAQAVRLANVVVVDGQKEAGINSIYKDLRKTIEQVNTCVKAHGRIIWFTVNPADLPFQEWQDQPQMADGMITRAGVFSAGRIDAGSKLLLENMPDKLQGDVADFGAGWGYLSRAVLQQDTVKTLSLVEADKIALDCARENIADTRATFIWGDATAHKGHYDTIIMNPPFHQGRAGSPKLGQAFIKNAAACLKKKGQVFVVANRHLPYEETLKACFATVTALENKNGFKVYKATHPKL